MPGRGGVPAGEPGPAGQRLQDAAFPVLPPVEQDEIPDRRAGLPVLAAAPAARRARPAPLSQTISKQPRRTAVMRAGIPRASCGRSVRRNPYCSIFKCCSLRIKYRFQMFGRSGLSFPSGLSSPRRKNPAETEPFSLSPRDCPACRCARSGAQKRTRQTCPALRSLLRDSIHERWRKRRKSAGRSPRSRSVPGYSVLVESHLINCRHQALLPVCSDQTEGFADIISHFAQKCKGEFFPRRAAAGKTGKISAEARPRPVNDKKRRRLLPPSFLFRPPARPSAGRHSRFAWYCQSASISRCFWSMISFARLSP